MKTPQFEIGDRVQITAPFPGAEQATRRYVGRFGTVLDVRPLVVVTIDRRPEDDPDEPGVPGSWSCYPLQPNVKPAPGQPKSAPDWETEAAELRSRIRHLIQERDRYRFLADQKWALRREIEELLGMKPGEPASDGVLRLGLERIRWALERAKAWEQAAKALHALLPDYGGPEDDGSEPDARDKAELLLQAASELERRIP